MNNTTNIPRVITRDRVFKHKRSQDWSNIFLNQPKLMQNISINNDLYISMKISTYYVANTYVTKFLKDQKKIKGFYGVDKIYEPYTSAKNNKMMTLELSTTLLGVDDTIETCMSTLHKNILQIGDCYANIKNNISNVEILNKDDLINNYTFLQLDNSKTVYLDTGEIKLWTNQQDLAFYLLDREYYYTKLKNKMIEFNNENKNEDVAIEGIYERMPTFFRTTINLNNPKALSYYPYMYNEGMEIKHYLYGKSYPLLASIKNSIVMNKVVIITSCPLISYRWAKSCEKMHMTYKVLEENYDLSPNLIPDFDYGPTNGPHDVSIHQFEDLPEIDNFNNRQVIIIGFSHYISETLNRDIVKNIGKCIIDMQAVDTSTLTQYEKQMQFLSDQLIMDQFDTVYNLTDKYIPEPRLGIFGWNNSSTMNLESIIMPPVCIYDDNTIKIHNEYCFIRKDQICSIILVNFENDGYTEENIRFRLQLPTFLTLYNSAEEYVKERLKITNDQVIYNKKMQQIHEKECKICFQNFENEIVNNQAIINYSCCGSTCCLSCFNLNFNEKQLNAFKCFNCRATEDTRCEESVIDSYLEKFNAEFKKDTRVLVLGSFPTREIFWKIVNEYIYKWFENVSLIFDLFEDSISFNQLQNKKFDNPNGSWAILIDTNKYNFNPMSTSPFPFNPIHFENVNTVVFLPSVPAYVKKLYMSSFCCSNTELKIYHFQVEEPSAYISFESLDSIII